MFERFKTRQDWYVAENNALSASQFGNEARGEFVVERAVHTERCWKKPSPFIPVSEKDKEKNKKNLIITDYTVYRNADAMLFLEALLQDGFTLYFSRDMHEDGKAIVRVTSVSELMSAAQRIPNFFREEILALMSAKEIAADNALIIDYFYMNQLRYAPLQQPMQILNLDDFKDMPTIAMRYHFFERMSQVRVGIRISNRYFPPMRITDIFKAFPDMVCLWLESDDPAHLKFILDIRPSLHETLEVVYLCDTSNGLPSQTVIKNSRAINFLTKLQKIKQLEYHGRRSVPSWLHGDFTRVHPQLESLTLDVIHFAMVAYKHRPASQLLHLTIIDLVNTEIEFSTLRRLLACSPQLKSLTAKTKFTNDASDLPLVSQPLSQLTHVALSGDFLPVFMLADLLNRGNKVQSLALHYVSILGSMFPLTENLHHLQTLNLSGSKFYANMINVVFAHSAQIQTLILQDCQVIDGKGKKDFLCLENLSRLRKLDLSNSEIKPEAIHFGATHFYELTELHLGRGPIILDEFADFLAHFSNVINLSAHKFSSKQGFCLPPSINKLTHLELWATHGFGYIQLILEKNPQLKFIKFSSENCTLNGKFSPSQVHQLEHLHFHSHKLTRKELANLLAYFPNLKTLSVEIANFSLFNIDAYTLSRLRNMRELHFSNVLLSYSTLRQLLEKNVMLTTLKISNGKIAREDRRVFQENGEIVDEEEDIILTESLPALDLLMFEGGVLHYFFVGRLISYMPNLRVLDLRKVKFLAFTQQWKDYAGGINRANLSNLREINVEASNISNEILEAFLVHCMDLEVLNIKECHHLIPSPALKKLLKKAKIIYYPTANWLDTQREQAPSASISRPVTRHDAKPRKISNGVPAIPSLRVDRKVKRETITVFHLDNFFRKKPSHLTQPPSPDDYRLRVETEDRLQTFVSIAREQLSVDALRKKYEEAFEDKKNCYYGIYPLSLVSGQRYALPACTTEDSLLAIAAEINLLVTYCKEEDLYYVELAADSAASHQAINIHYIIHAPEMTPYTDSPVTAWVKHYQGFGQGELRGVSANDSDDVWLAAREKQKIGSCADRTLAFMRRYRKNISHVDFVARSVNSKSHAWVEVRKKTETKWHPCDLGGYPAESKETSMHMPVDRVAKKDKGKEKIVEPNSREKESENDDRADLLQASTPSLRAERSKPATSLDSFATLAMTATSKANPFITWKNVTPPNTSYDNYCQWLEDQVAIQFPDQRHINIQLTGSSAAFTPFLQALLLRTHHRDRRLYYVDNFNDEPCHDICITEKDYTIIPSNMMAFMANAKAGDVFVVNHRVGSCDIGKKNALMDDDRKLINVSVAPGVQIIFLFDEHDKQALGCDASSRFGLKLPLPVIDDATSQQRVIDEVSASSSLPCDLFDGDDWQGILLGGIQIHGQRLLEKKGVFAAAAEEGCDELIIRNGLVGDIAFEFFLAQVMLTRHYRVHGQPYQLPEKLRLKRDKSEPDLQHGYTLAVLAQPCSYVLNDNTYPYFFKTYRYDNNELYEEAGWLEVHQGETLRVRMTTALSAQALAKLLREAEKYHCHLEITVAPTVALPATMRKSETSTAIVPTAFDAADAIAAFATIIITNDADYTQDEIRNDDCMIVRAHHNMDYADLFGTITKTNHADGAFLFHYEMSAIVQALQARKTVVITGSLSTEVMTQMASLLEEPPYLLLLGKKIDVSKGKLFLVMEDEAAFSFANKRYRQEVTPSLCRKKLEQAYSDHHEQTATLFDELEKLQQKNVRDILTWQYAQLKTMLQRMLDGEKNPWLPFLLLKKESKKWLQCVHQDREKSEAEASSPLIRSSRKPNKVMEKLEKNGHVLLIGPPGVGKTHMFKRLKEAYRADGVMLKLRFGLESLAIWAQRSSKNNKKIALCIDEANLKMPGMLECFEGLYQTPRGILINGKFHPIGEHQLVIFTGNYQNEPGRQAQPFLERYAAIVHMKKFPDYLMLDDIMRPVLMPVLADDAQFTFVSNLFLAAYHHIKKTHLLTPRQLQMLCLRFRLAMEEKKDGKKNCVDAMKMKCMRWYAKQCMKKYEP